MATARSRYLQNLFVKKYGAVGRVASRYLEAGYSVEFMHPTRYGAVHVLAKKGGEVLAIDVVESPGTVSDNAVKLLLEKSRLLKAKPILVLYSEGPRISEELYKFCLESGVKIRRIKS